jgi:hypothetical protein
VQTRAKRRMLIATLSIAVVCLLSIILWTRGRHELVLQGTLQTGPEQSAFFLDGDCSKIPFWFNWPDQRDYDLNTRWHALGEPAALRVKLLGRVSDVGKYGHLGAYPREVQLNQDDCGQSNTALRMAGRPLRLRSLFPSHHSHHHIGYSDGYCRDRRSPEELELSSSSPWQNYGKCSSGDEACGTGKRVPSAG